jgi:hypothetical protein
MLVCPGPGTFGRNGEGKKRCAPGAHLFLLREELQLSVEDANFRTIASKSLRSLSERWAE